MKKHKINRKVVILLAFISCLIFSKPIFGLFRNTDTVINKIGCRLFEFNKIKVVATKGIELKEIKIKVSESDKTVFCKGRQKKINRVGQDYGYTIMEIYYKELLIAEIGHFKTNNWFTHDYNISVSNENNQIHIKHEINGPTGKSDNFQKKYIYDTNNELLRIDYLTESGKIYNSKIVKTEISENNVNEIEKETNKIENSPYPFDTVLTNGFHLSHQIYKHETDGDIIQSLTLCKGTKKIRVLNETSHGLPFKNLGYVSADFGETFVFTQSFGSGNPHYIQLIEKEKGKELKKGVLVDADEDEQVLLYLTDDSSEDLILYDIKHGKEISIKDFDNSICATTIVGGKRDCVRIKNVTSSKIVLWVDTDNEKVIKEYNR